MRKLIILIICLIAATHKSEQTYYTNNITVERDILPYFNYILRTFDHANVKIDLTQPISIKFSDDLPDGVIGIAKGMFDHTRVEILISREYWYSFSKTERMWTLLHEMGHDFFMIYHYGEGIMRPYHTSGETTESFNKAFFNMIIESKLHELI